MQGIGIHKITCDSRSGIKNGSGLTPHSYAAPPGGMSTKSIGEIYIVTKGWRTGSGNVRLLIGAGGRDNSEGASAPARAYAELENVGGGDGVRSRDVDFCESRNERRCSACVWICDGVCSSSCSA